MSAQDAPAAGTVRPFRAEDAACVAALFTAVMPAARGKAGADLAGYFRRHYLEGPFADPDCPSLVHLSGAGEVEGFAGRVVQPFAFKGRTLRVAIVGTLMVRDHHKTPMAGARLLKGLMAGPQDLTFSETAGDASLLMWRQLRGAVLDRHSLDFFRVLKPARFALDLLAARIGPARLLAPLAALPDRVLAAKPGPLRWTGLPQGFRPERGVRSEPIAPEDFAALFLEWTGKDEAVPLWPGACFPAVLSEALSKRAYGEPHLRVALAGSGKPLGAYLFHFGRSGAARATDIVHAPGQAGPVLDALFADAQALGASSVRGRTTPQLLDALLSRRTLLAHGSASVIAGKDEEAIAAFQAGGGHLNGLVGERWTRLIGDRFGDAAETRRSVNPNPGLAAPTPRVSL